MRMVRCSDLKEFIKEYMRFDGHFKLIHFTDSFDTKILLSLPRYSPVNLETLDIIVL